MRTVLITGTAGFIGFHLATLMLSEGFRVVGLDGMTDYYDVRIKQRRHQMLLQNPNFTSVEGMLEDFDTLHRLISETRPDVIVHLAAQAGVRYSLENPRAYMSANVMGTFNVMECAREFGVDHLLMASTSSVYGANDQMPFIENEKTESQLTLYAATKKANENMGHCYAHLWKIPTTMFRFFTVYGPWGRPDLALFKFVKAALNGDAIDVYNHGNMARDFTYVTDLVRGIRLLIDTPPVEPADRSDIDPGDSLSPVAPFRVVNIGNGTKVQLMDFIVEIEKSLGLPIKKNFMDMQKGDVPATWANSDLLHRLTGYRPETSVAVGVKKFVDWYRDYYDIPDATIDSLRARGGHTSGGTDPAS
jgi:UDP-glucuronate 4-epimerase